MAYAKKEEYLIILRGTKVQGRIFRYSSKGGMSRMKKTLYWVQNNQIMSAQAEWWDDDGKSGWFKDTTTTEVLQSYNNNEEAKVHFRKLVQLLKCPTHTILGKS